MTIFKQNVKGIFLYSVLILSTQQCSYSRAGEVPEVVVKEVAKVGLSEILEVMAEVGPYVSVALQLRSIVQEIRVYNFPDEEEKEQAIRVVKQYVLLATEKGLEDCIIKNRDTSERVRSGLPSACEKIAGALHTFGGKKDLERMTANYNEYRKQI